MKHDLICLVGNRNICLPFSRILEICQFCLYVRIEYTTMLASVHFSTHGLIAEYTSNPTVAVIKIKTTSWSLVESLSIFILVFCVLLVTHELTEASSEYISLLGVFTDLEPIT
jgi:hypothetical protein